MSYISEIKTFLNKQLPMWMHGRVVPQGIVLPVDPYLQGVARCAKKLGDRMPVLMPNNQMKLASDLSKRDMQIQIDPTTVLDYLEPNYLVSLAGRQIIKVGLIAGQTLSFAPETLLSDDEQGSKIDLSAGSPIFVYGIPGTNVADANEGATVLQFKFPFPVTRGDVLAISTKVPGYFREYAVSEILSEDYLIKQARVLIPGNGPNGHVTYTAVEPGSAGNSLTVQHVNNGLNQSLAIQVSGGNAITVSLATDGSGVVVSTAKQVSDAINSLVTSAALVKASFSGNGSHSTQVCARTNLQGGLEESAPYYYQAQVTAVASVTTLPTSMSPVAAELLAESDGPGIYRSLDDGDEIFLRAFPAYFSKLLPIRTSYPSSTAAIGPFFLDRVTGLIGDNPAGVNKVLEEFVNLQLYNGLTMLRDLRLRTDRKPTEPREVRSPQFPVWNANIESEHLLLWQVDRGSLQLIDDQLVLIPDERGVCQIHRELVVSPGEHAEELPKYRMVVSSDKPFTVSARFFPSDPVPVEVTTPDASGRYVTSVILDGIENARAVKLSVSGENGQLISVRALASERPSVTHVRYQILAKTIGHYHWASSGLLLKPMFLSAALTDAYGTSVQMDSGRVLLEPQSPTKLTKRPSQADVQLVVSTEVVSTNLVAQLNSQMHGGLTPAYQYRINWGDGSPEELAQHSMHVYPRGVTPQSFSLTVTVTDAFGSVAVKSLIIQVPSL